MDFEWVAIAVSDVTWLSLAFALGFLAKQVNLPPLVGYLVTGFILNYYGIISGQSLQKLADLGITLLLFTIGLKLDLKVLIKPQVWSITLLHMILIILLFGLSIFGLSLLGLPLVADLDFKHSLLIAFGLSFSSTVFVVKSLEAKGEMHSLHGQIAIGILIMQDLAAVIFLAASTGKLPTYWAPLLLFLIPLKPIFSYILNKTGHGELLILYALVLALGGAELFELCGVKDDLGALFMGILISYHPRAKEMAKSMLGFKDLFLVGFFLTIGLSGELSLETLIIGALLVPFIFVKSTLFYLLMTRFKLRARTSLMATLNLSNYSEFGLIVIAIAVSNFWITGEWLVIIAIAVSLSFIISAKLNEIDNKLYGQLKPFWLRFQSEERLKDDRIINLNGETIAIFGMGRIGSGAFKKMQELHGKSVVGIDSNIQTVTLHQEIGRNVLQGDPTDADFWEKIDPNHRIKLVMLALPKLNTNIAAIEQLKKTAFSGKITATARYSEEVDVLLQAGATEVFDIHTEIGAAFAESVDY
ncbi:MAG: potassium transporter Kef [Gammaproteobacteria bacterium]|nr:MAG: potassium transporter Kef [Gammaproteobacteria bacterium]